MTTSAQLPAVLPRPRRRWKTPVLVTLVFLSGMAVGGGAATALVVHRLQQVLRHPDEIADRLSNRLTRRLGLAPHQKEEVRRLIMTRIEHVGTIRREVEPRLRSEIEGLHADIRAALTPQQQTAWDSLFDDFSRHWLPPVGE